MDTKNLSRTLFILLLLCLQIQGWPAAPFLLCGSSHQPHYTRQTWLPGSRSRIVVVSCCDVAHRRNGHGLACTGCHPSARKTSRRPGLRPRPGDQISTGPPSITYNNTGKNIHVMQRKLLKFYKLASMKLSIMMNFIFYILIWK